MTISGLAAGLLLVALLLVVAALRVRRRPLVGATVGLNGLNVVWFLYNLFFPPPIQSKQDKAKTA